MNSVAIYCNILEYAKFSAFQVVPPKQQQIIAAVVVCHNIKGLQKVLIFVGIIKNGYKTVTKKWQR